MPKIIIYTTPTCVYCKMAKAFFKEYNIAYEERDVAADATARDEMIKKSNQMGVPVIDIEGQIITGFDKNRLADLLSVK
ncbi:MAG: glutathione S-transferase N-terminal domain-containing protein [Parcubacteria group bacterium]|nr:glutathione S-transferase N-terminal domain-containing protein [Parcubacteria group bacterium]